MKDNLTVFVDDPSRHDVIQAVDFDVGPSSAICSLVDELKYSTSSPSFLLVSAVERLLEKFGAISRTQAGNKARRIVLLCSLLSLAVVSYSGSHCSDLGQRIFGSQLMAIEFRGINAPDQFYFRRRQLACLDDFIGGPVWVFGNRRLAGKARISISIKQFSDLWGPLYAVPSYPGLFGELIALHTDGGILYCSQEGDWRSKPLGAESVMHWVKVSPIRRQREQQAQSGQNLLVSCGNEERLPDKLNAFPPSDRLLIGQPTLSTSGSATMTSGCQATQSMHLSLAPSTASVFSHNEQCVLDLAEFGRMNTFRLQTVGAREAYYAPDEYQLNFNGGQYINIGFQKVWKRRPAINHKTMLLEYCSKPRARPDAVRKILQTRVGLELSACTSNAQRITLEEALKLAFLQSSKRSKLFAALETPWVYQCFLRISKQQVSVTTTTSCYSGL